VLDPTEARFPFQGPVLLRSTEGRVRVETDAVAVRDGYLAALARIGASWSQRLLAGGGRFVDTVTSDNPADIVRRVVGAAGGVQ
jgi:hypothetical protein